MVFVQMRKENGVNDCNEGLPTPIQVLVTAATGFATAPGCSWLHGFCLLTCRQDGGTISVTGKLMTGERFADDRPVIEALTGALDERATLVGLDLTDMIGSLGRLPVDAQDQRPALALLAKLRAMLTASCPVDLSLTEDSQAALVEVAHAQGLSLREHWVGEGEERRPALRGGIDNANAARLAAELVDTAGACLLTVAKLHLGNRAPQVASAWRRWRSELQLAPALIGSSAAEQF